MNSRCIGRVALAWIMLLGWPGPAIAQNAGTGTVPAPKLSIEKRFLDLGQVREGDTLSPCFELRNAGKAPLRILAVKSNRDGFHADHPGQVPPEGTARVCLSIATLGTHGLRTFKSILRTDDPAAPSVTLGVRADIDPLVRLTPTRVFFNAAGEQQDDLTQQIRIDNRGPNPVNVTLQPHRMADKIKADLTPVKPGKQYRLTVRNIAPAPVGYRGRLVLHTDHPGRERIAVPVFAHLPAPVALYPQELTLATGRCRQCRARGIYTGHVLLRAHDKKPLHVLSTGPQRRDLQLTIEPLAAGQAFRIEVRYESGETPAPERLVIQTDREGFETIAVPVKIGDR